MPLMRTTGDAQISDHRLSDHGKYEKKIITLSLITTVVSHRDADNAQDLTFDVRMML